MLSYIVPFLTISELLTVSITSRSGLEIIRKCFESESTKDSPIAIDIIQKLDEKDKIGKKSALFLLSPIRVLLRRLKTLDCNFFKLRASSMSILSIYSLAIEKIWMRYISVSGLRYLSMFKSLCNVSLGSVGLGRVNACVFDYNIITILRLIGRNLVKFSLYKLVSLSSLILFEIADNCRNLRELVIFACPRIYKSQYPYYNLEITQEIKNDQINLKSIIAFSNKLGRQMKILDLRYSVDIDSQIFEVLEKGNCSFERFVLKHSF